MNTIMRWFGAAALGMALGAIAPAATADDRRYGSAELDRLLAPIALYPDSVLSHVLIAATYPLEIVQAARWSRAHSDLSGEDAVQAVEGKGWDPSVEALVAFPEILARMDEDLDWTHDLGEAFLAQEAEVMDRVQLLRARAYEAGRLGSLEHVRVIREREYIYIEPAVRHVVYVPYYDPWYVYGSWWWPDYPPYCWRTWHGRPVAYYGSRFYWGVGFPIAPTFYFTAFHWPARHVVVVHDHRHSRPLYSGRDVTRHQTEVRRWRHDERRYSSPAQRQERRRSAAQAAPEQRRSAREAAPADVRPARRADRAAGGRAEGRPDPRNERGPREERRSAPTAPQGRAARAPPPDASPPPRGERAARQRRETAAEPSHNAREERRARAPAPSAAPAQRDAPAPRSRESREAEDAREKSKRTGSDRRMERPSRERTGRGESESRGSRGERGKNRERRQT